MKTKKFEQKLVLNKKTIADLNYEAMKKVQGGDSIDICVTDRVTRCETLECCGTWKRTCDC